MRIQCHTFFRLRPSVSLSHARIQTRKSPSGTNNTSQKVTTKMSQPKTDTATLADTKCKVTRSTSNIWKKCPNPLCMTTLNIPVLRGSSHQSDPQWAMGNGVSDGVWMEIAFHTGAPCIGNVTETPSRAAAGPSRRLHRLGRHRALTPEDWETAGPHTPLAPKTGHRDVRRDSWRLFKPKLIDTLACLD